MHVQSSQRVIIRIFNLLVVFLYEKYTAVVSAYFTVLLAVRSQKTISSTAEAEIDLSSLASLSQSRGQRRRCTQMSFESGRRDGRKG